jgi:hypothetical protein
VDYVRPSEPKQPTTPAKAEGVKKDEDLYASQVVNELKVGEDYIRPWRAPKRGYQKLYISQCW